MPRFCHRPIEYRWQYVERGRRNTLRYSALRGLGVTVRKTIDTIIATRCILSGLELLHNDRDFEPFATHLALRCVALDT